MTRQIYPHHATPSVFAVEERLHTVEERLHRVESALAMLTEGLEALAEELGGDSHEGQDEDGSGLARHIHALLARVTAAQRGQRPPQASA